jgi:hypothetical protein
MFHAAEPRRRNQRRIPPGLTVARLRELCQAAGIALRTYYERRTVGLSHDEALVANRCPGRRPPRRARQRASATPRQTAMTAEQRATDALLRQFLRSTCNTARASA